MNEHTGKWIISLEEAWSKPDGFLAKVRDGQFETRRADEFIALLQSIHLQKDTLVDRRLVSLIWYIPMFLSWQKDRISEHGGNVEAFERFANRVHGIVEDILGVP